MNAFIIERSMVYGGMHMKDRVRHYGQLVIDTTAEGGAVAGDLPASMFGGLRLIENASHAVADDDSVAFPTVPSYDGASLIVGGGAAGVPQDLPDGIYRLMVEGIK